MNKIATSLLAVAATAKIHEGSCPSTVESNIPLETFSAKPLTGLWFEYVWDKEFDDGFDYKCSMWTVLDDETKFVAFNHLHFSEDDGKFGQLDLNLAEKTPEGHQP